MAVTPPVPLFPPPPSLSFAKDGGLQAAVSAAIAELVAAGRSVRFSLAIIDQGDGGKTSTLGWGAHKPGEMHYIASGPKIAAMYAAFALRDMVRRLWAVGRMVPAVAAFGGVPSSRLPATATSLAAALKTLVDPAIEDASPADLASVRKNERLPTYSDLFAMPKTGWGPQPSFTGAFDTSLREMIVPSSNTHAGKCIRADGYGYLNGALAAAGLLKDDTKVWLAGDYIGLYHYARIASTNDGAVAQAGTALGMAQLMAIILQGGVVLDGDAFTRMEGLLAAATRGIDRPFLSRDFPGDSVKASVRIPLAKITHAKLGQGPLKAGDEVRSETFRLAGLRKASKNYIIAFQNVLASGDGLDDVALAVRRTLEIYEGP